MSETIRSRSNREIGQEVEGKTILEKRVVIPPDPVNRRLGVYEYVVASRLSEKKPSLSPSPANTAGFVRQTPEEHGGGLTRRINSR